MAFFSDTSSTRSGGSSSLFADVIGGVGNLFSLISRYRSYTKAEAQLFAMSDRDLDDLGISRGDIRARVWSDFGKH